jgi:hypothetical protein
MIIIGGINSKDQFLNDAWAFDIDAQKWLHLAVPQGPGIANTAFSSTSSGMLIFGTGKSGTAVQTAHVFTDFFTLSLFPIDPGSTSGLATVEPEYVEPEKPQIIRSEPETRHAAAPSATFVPPKVDAPAPPREIPTTSSGASLFESAVDYYLKSKDTLAEHKARLMGTQSTLTTTEISFSEKLSPLLSKQPDNEAALSSWFDSTSDIAEELAKRRATAASKMENVRNALTELDKAELQISTLKRVNATLSQQFSILRASKVGLDSIRSRLRDSKDSFLGLVKDEEEILQHLAELYTQDIANAQHSDRVQKQCVRSLVVRVPSLTFHPFVENLTKSKTNIRK